MKRLRAPARGLHVGTFSAAGALFHYVTRVHRLRAGDRVTLFDPEQRVEAEASLIAVAEERVDFAIAALAPGRVQAEREVRIIQGWPKGDKLDAIVRDATELGASELWLCATERAVPSVSDESRLRKKLERLARIAEEAARQSGRTDVPILAPPRTFTDCLEADTADHRLLLTPDAAQPLGPTLRSLPPDASVSFYIGPEGGFSDPERHAAQARGLALRHCGPFVLRTETVVAALLGGLRLLDPSPPR